MSSKDQAQAALAKMKSPLASWLDKRKMVDEAADGTRAASFSPDVVAQFIDAYRDTDMENRLAEELRALLGEVVDPATVGLDKLDAPALAAIVVTGKLPTAAPTPQQGVGIGPLILLVVLGAIGWTISSSIQSYADVVKAQENGLACRAAGIPEAPEEA